MIEKITTNYMSAECNQLRDKVNEILDLLDKGKPHTDTQDSVRILKNGNVMLNDKIITNAKARELGLK